ncbi:MAG: ABC transporter substrate-binding protein [Candidatus Thermoplasmatota archaeon]|nr:ABC transporter substrate-binding protein [Candidatus Thermoplasmatota archaeon]
MSSQGMSKSAKRIWTVLVIVLTAVVAFTGGFLAGTTISNTGEGFTIVDDYGRAVTLEGIPQRIVSIAPSPTEILFAIGAGPQVVGVDNYSDYPAEVATLTKVGDYTLNLETIVSLQPDLIVGGDLVPLAQLEQLEAQGIPYVLLADRTLEDVLKTIRLAGVITGHVEEADAVAQELSERIDAVKEKTLAVGVSKPKVYIEYDEFMGLWTYGPGSFGDDLITAAGGTNVAHNTASEYPMVESEFVIAQNPEIIIYTTGPWSTLSESTYLNRPGWSTIDAVENGDIYGMDANLLSRYGPRIVDCLEQLAEMIHPEMFP